MRWTWKDIGINSYEQGKELEIFLTNTSSWIRAVTKALIKENLKPLCCFYRDFGLLFLLYENILIGINSYSFSDPKNYELRLWDRSDPNFPQTDPILTEKYFTLEELLSKIIGILND